MYIVVYHSPTCHILPPSEIDVGLFWAVLQAQKGNTYFTELAERVAYVYVYIYIYMYICIVHIYIYIYIYICIIICISMLVQCNWGPWTRRARRRPAASSAPRIIYTISFFLFLFYFFFYFLFLFFSAPRIIYTINICYTLGQGDAGMYNIHTYIYIYIYIHRYTYIERERERQRENMYIYIYIYYL